MKFEMEDEKVKDERTKEWKKERASKRKKKRTKKRMKGGRGIKEKNK